MIAFAKRNLKLFLRDKSSVVFSLLGVIIVIGLYVVFLGDVWTSDLDGVERAREMMDNWVMGGVLAITSVTTSLGILANMVSDKENKVVKDLYVAPVKRVDLIGGYMLSAYVIGLIMSIFAFVLAEIYIVANGGEMITVMNALKVLGLIAVVDFMNSAIMYFVVSFIKSMSAYSTVSTIVGTLIGFITGIYLPIYMFPDAVQWIIRCCPFAHGALLFRQVMMEPVMSDAFSGAPVEIVDQVREELGIVFSFGDFTVSFPQSLIVIVVTGIVFFILACLFEKKTSRA